MSRWEEEFNNHPIHATLGQIRDWLATKLDEPDSEHTTEKLRLNKIVSYLSKALDGIDKESVPIAWLDQINQHLRQPHFWEQVKAYGGSPKVEYLMRANDQINSQIPAICHLSLLSKNPSSVQHDDSVQKAFVEFSAAVDSKMKEVSSEVARKRTELETMEKNQSSIKKEVDALSSIKSEKLNEWHTQFTEAQTSRSEAFTQKQSDQTNEFDEWFNKYKSDTNQSTGKIIENWNTELENFYEEFKNKIKNQSIDAEKKHQSIREIHGLVAEDSVAGGYKQLADHERDQANFWRIASILFIVATAIWIALTYLTGFNTTENNEVIWVQVIKATSLTGVLLFGAVYASKQSNLHRNNEKQTRWFALEVKAIDPFISSLSEDQQRILKEKFSEKLFGQNSTSQTPPPANFDPNFLKTIGDMVKDIASISK